tara:strand:+ start:39 stop:464 length:426 start_codon:yes stop_codon:yes gene_type:complete
MKKIIFLPILFLLVACGPSETLEEKHERIVNSWRDFVFDKEVYKSGSATISAWITDDNRGVVVRYSESKNNNGLKDAVIAISEGLNIPDHIREKILITAPRDEMQEDEFDDVIITWDVISNYDAGTIDIGIVLYSSIYWIE